MEDFAVTTMVGIGGLIVGLVFGATAQLTNFCTMGAVSDLVLMGDGRRIRAWVLAIAVAIIGSHLLHFGGLIDLGKSVYLTTNFGWLGAIIGGVLFGFGMTQAGGCGSRALVRIGGGNLKSLIVYLVLGTFAYMTMRGLLAVPRLALEGASNIDLGMLGLKSQALVEMLARSTGATVEIVRLPFAFAVAALFLFYCFQHGPFRQSPRDVLAGLILGALVPLGWYITGVIGNDDFQPVPLASLTFVAPTGDSLQYLMTFTGATVSFGIACVAGVVGGSFIAALASGAFHWEAFVDRADLMRHLSGGALMGTGGVLALGCTIGQGLSGMSTLAMGSIIAWLAILAGGAIGVKYLEEGTLVGAIRGVFARG